MAYRLMSLPRENTVSLTESNVQLDAVSSSQGHGLRNRPSGRGRPSERKAQVHPQYGTDCQECFSRAESGRGLAVILHHLTRCKAEYLDSCTTRKPFLAPWQQGI
ncbi:hypothetical protein BDV10DRAFT_160939 [Aspergillus recurvatus]